MKHTPGPWEVTVLYPGQYFEIRAETFDVVTATSGLPPLRREADARLIAAAPELLELLMELQEIVFITRNNELHTRMEAVIAKAKGYR